MLLAIAHACWWRARGGARRRANAAEEAWLIGKFFPAPLFEGGGAAVAPGGAADADHARDDEEGAEDSGSSQVLELAVAVEDGAFRGDASVAAAAAAAIAPFPQSSPRRGPSCKALGRAWAARSKVGGHPPTGSGTALAVEEPSLPEEDGEDDIIMT